MNQKVKSITLITINSLTLLLLFQNCTTFTKNSAYNDAPVHGIVCAANPDSTVAPYFVSDFKIIALKDGLGIESITNDLKNHLSLAKTIRFNQAEDLADCFEQKTYTFAADQVTSEKMLLLFISEPEMGLVGGKKIYGRMFNSSEVKNTTLNLNPSDFSLLGEI